MGGGSSMTSSSWKSYAQKTNITNNTTQQTYTSRNMKDEYNPRLIKFRESRDSDLHPESTPIIIGLDVTGSMGSILQTVAQKLGTLVVEIMQRNPVSDPQILFAAIGDVVWDYAPLQVTQFEVDEKIADQLSNLWFEQGGGGNGSESYTLSWYFAANKVQFDAKEKRGKKGILITMGDDDMPSSLTKSQIESVFGSSDMETSQISSEDLLSIVNRDWEVFHIMFRTKQTRCQYLLGERAIFVQDYEKIPELIVSLLDVFGGKSLDDAVSTWDNSTSLVVRDAIKDLPVNKSTGSDLVSFD